MNDDPWWQEEVLGVDLERSCSQPTSESCWLCDNLEDWNAVLNPLCLDLIEWQVGKLQLCSLVGIAEMHYSKDCNTRYDAAYVMAWLPRKHSCIEAIRLNEHHPQPHILSFPEITAAECPLKLHHIVIAGSASYDWALLLDTLGSIVSLETFELRNVEVSKSFAAKAGELLSANCASIKTVTLSKATIPRTASEALVNSISKCKNLRELTLSSNMSTSALKNLAKLLRSTKTLKTLHLQAEPNVHTSESRYQRNEKGIALAVAELLRRNMSLVELHYQASNEATKNILMAVEANDTLKHLILTGDDYKVNYIDTAIGSLLESALSNNRGLCSLTLKGYKILSGVAALISKGLQANATLESLDVSQCCVDVTEVRVLCNALKQNKTLQKLQIEAHSASKSERLELYAELDKNQWYSRIQLSCINMVTQELVKSLSQPSLCPTDIHLVVDKDSGASFTALFKALSTSLSVKSLSVSFNGAQLGHLTSLLTTLEENKSLRSVTLRESFLDSNCAVMVVQGLILNESVVELTLECRELSSMSAELIALLLESNEILYKFHLSSLPELTFDLVRTISQGVVENKFITETNVGCEASFVRAAVQRNVTQLHRAVRFVLRRNVGKRCAASFELLESKPSLISGLQSAAGMTEVEAKCAVKAARHFLWTNYLFINYIVHHKLECYPEEVFKSRLFSLNQTDKQFRYALTLTESSEVSLDVKNALYHRHTLPSQVSRVFLQYHLHKLRTIVGPVLSPAVRTPYFIGNMSEVIDLI
ncbi:uncharacterized protein LOC142557476 isoform X1 [Dermacentor variabilis]|uniref:uncharacterized protein LOC142557476 isoform X1 n=1 Tax=Dermacentor variabilis TaxID=34621 RepID=UPI003F5CA242